MIFPPVKSKMAAGTCANMPLPFHTRIGGTSMKSDELPVGSTTSMDKEYLALVGEVIFLYNMYEETLAATIQKIVPGFWSWYWSDFRFNPKHVLRHYLHAASLVKNEAMHDEMARIASAYYQAMDIRSAVAHGRPATDSNDNDRQVLNYQTGLENPPMPGEKVGTVTKTKKPKREVVNRYKEKLLTYSLLKEACEELERGCARARTFYSKIRELSTEELTVG